METEQLSRDQRRAAGKAARADVPARVARRTSTSTTTAIRSALPAGTGRVPGAGAGAAPARPDAGLAVHVLPRRRAADGRGPGADAELGSTRPAVRGCPPVQLRRLRRTGAAVGLRHQRLRRDAPRSVRVGRQAARRQLRRRRTGQRPLRTEASRRRASRRSSATAPRCGSSPAMPMLDVWYARTDVDDALRKFGAQLSGKARARRQGPRQGPHPRQLAGASRS